MFTTTYASLGKILLFETVLDESALKIADEDVRILSGQGTAKPEDARSHPASRPLPRRGKDPDEEETSRVYSVPKVYSVP